MNAHSSSDFERWEELETARLLFGLDAAEQTEYDELSRRLPAERRESFDQVVAALDVAWSHDSAEELPASLHEAIRRRAAQELHPTIAVQASTTAPSESKPCQHDAGTNTPDESMVRPRGAGSSAGHLAIYVPWLVTVASLLLAAYVVTVDRNSDRAAPDLAAARSALLASGEQLIQASWTPGPTPLGDVTGDVVWSSNRQQGYMRFRGLPANRPDKEQYQLWIFDKNQSDKTPIDGGVFDVTTTGETLVPIDAKLRVQEAFLFAITIEKPGGVVVSSRERLPLLAKVE